MTDNVAPTAQEMTSRFSPEDKLLISCDMGGLLDKDPSKCVSSTTFEAIYLLHQCGFRNLKYIKARAHSGVHIMALPSCIQGFWAQRGICE